MTYDFPREKKGNFCHFDLIIINYRIKGSTFLYWLVLVMVVVGVESEEDEEVPKGRFLGVGVVEVAIPTFNSGLDISSAPK